MGQRSSTWDQDQGSPPEHDQCCHSICQWVWCRGWSVYNYIKPRFDLIKIFKTITYKSRSVVGVILITVPCRTQQVQWKKTFRKSNQNKWEHRGKGFLWGPELVIVFEHLKPRHHERKLKRERKKTDQSQTHEVKIMKECLWLQPIKHLLHSYSSRLETDQHPRATVAVTSKASADATGMCKCLHLLERSYEERKVY